MYAFVLDGIKFDWTISFSTLIELILLIASVVGLYTKIKDELNNFKVDMINDMSEIKNNHIEMTAKVDLMYDWFRNKIERRNGASAGS